MTAISSHTPDLPPDLDAHRPPAPDARARAFKAAQAHSAWVRRLRWLVPLSAAAAVVIAITGWIASLFTNVDLNIASVDVSGSRITMAQPILRGEDQDGRPYVLEAREAFQTVSANPIVDLRDLTGTIAISDDDAATVTAPQATFDSETNQIVFENGGVEVTLASGGTALLGVTQIDLEEGTLVTDEPVRVVQEQLELDAAGLDGFDGGTRLVFRGGVRMVLQPQAGEN